LQVKNKLNVYNARVAWALINAYSVLKKERYIDAARRNIEWAIRQQNENGWFAYNDFDCNKSPLTHTIAYAAEGILEAGIYFQKDEYVNSVAKCCNALIHQISKDGLLSGRYDCNWNPRATWSCLAGDAQISIVLSKLFELTHIEEYHEVARNINNALKGIQGMCFANRNIDGGITGSWPIFGGYESYKYVSWAAKFFVDALLLEKS
jgi:uncharacterized protein YyaL (SSP411 family)